jgi:periplasmic mercuric ion binding protein
MKLLTLSLFALIGFVTIGKAQQTQKVVIQTPTVICEECKERIENYVKREPGVLTVNVDYKKKTTTITFLTDRNNIEGLRTAINNAGYDADGETADEDAYKALPACCKKSAAGTAKCVKQ